MNNLIGISGRMRSGKDTASNMIVELTNRRYEIKRFAGKLKLIASLLLGVPVEKFEDHDFKNSTLSSEWDWIYGMTDDHTFTRAAVKPGMEDRRKKQTVREFLQRLGTEAIRNSIHEEAWVNALFADYKWVAKSRKAADDDGGLITKREYYNDLPSWIIADVRFPNEYQAIKDRGGIVIRVNRPSLPVQEQAHPSETTLDNYKFDYVIENDGDIASLRSKVVNMIMEFKIPSY